MKAVLDGTYNPASKVSAAPGNYGYMNAVAWNNGAYDDFEAGESYLELSVTEENLVQKVCSEFDKVIVIINANNTMELGWVDEYPQIGAVLLVPGAGVTGFAALGEIMSGAVNPSGRTADTFVKDLFDTPYINNIGEMSFTNVDDLKAQIAANDGAYEGTLAFVNYVEGIYVGYKYYETASDEGAIKYEDKVQYPFGYGLSYTTFDQKIQNFKVDGGTVIFDVVVTNTGSVAGKDVVEVYFTPPYTNGGIEKASVNLIDFAKTEVIEPGASETLSFFFPLEDMAASLKEAHQNVTMVPLFFGLVKMERGEDGHWNFDFENFNKTARLYEKAGVLERLQLGEIGHRYEPRWESGFGLFVPDGKGGIETRKIDDPSVLEFYREFLPALKENLRANGWEEKAWQKVCDEPVDVNADDYRRVIGFLRSIYPSIRVMEALQTTRLSGVMDVWVPQLDTWHNNYDFFLSRQKAGDEVWFYTCCYPRGEYPNRFIEQPLLKTRMLYWMAFKYGATGYLHWGFNYWAGDPFGTADRPGTGTTLPGGDSWVVYPGYHKFESSLRYEALRDGIEDNTLLAMLRKKDPAAAEGICNRIIFNWWVYSTSPVEFNAARHQLLKALSE